MSSGEFRHFSSYVGGRKQSILGVVPALPTHLFIFNKRDIAVWCCLAPLGRSARSLVEVSFLASGKCTGGKRFLEIYARLEGGGGRGEGPPLMGVGVKVLCL